MRLLALLTLGTVSLGARLALAQAEPPGPPVYDPSRPLPTILPPDPPYAEPEAEEEAPPGAPSAAPNPQPESEPVPQAEPTYAAGAEPAPTYAAAPPAQEPPPPPSSRSRLHFRFPDFSAQLEVLNVLPYGRLGLPVDFEVLDWLTVGTQFTFVTAKEPLFVPSHIQQHSNGLGPIAGLDIGASFWPFGTTFDGMFVRVGLTNYSYRYDGFAVENYESEDVVAGAKLDSAAHTERRLSLLIGKGYQFGFLLVSGAVGIEYELNQQRRCLEGIRDGRKPFVPTRSGCNDDEFGIQRRVSGNNAFNVYDLGGPLYPFSLVAKLSVGFVYTRD